MLRDMLMMVLYYTVHIGIVLSTVCEIMQRAVKAIEEWRTSYQLAVSPTKTEMALFTRR